MKIQTSNKGVYLGRKRNFPFSKIYLSEKEIGHHVQIVGASGFGKTVLISHIVKSRIENGQGLLFIDQKGDLETIELFSTFVRNANREKDLKVFSLSDSTKSAPYNLLNNGTATELRDRIMGSLNWSEEFYKNQASSFLLSLLTGLTILREKGKLQLDLR